MVRTATGTDFRAVGSAEVDLDGDLAGDLAGKENSWWGTAIEKSAAMQHSRHSGAANVPWFTLIQLTD
jgi:hypothetical protein